MTDRLNPFGRPLVWGSILYVAAVMLLAFGYFSSGSKQTLVQLSLCAFAPACLYLGLRAPLVFPYCAYVLFLPADAVSSLGSGGTLAKLLGVLTAAFLLLRVIRRGQTVAAPPALVAWAVLLLWMGISMFWALDLRAAMPPFEMYASLIALFGLLAVVRTKTTEFNLVMAAVVVAGVLSAGYEAYLYHNGQGLVAANHGVSRVIIVVGDASIDPNSLASALLLPTAIALYWLLNSRHLMLVIAMPPTLAILLLGFAASGSRGGFIDLAVIFCYLVLRSRHRLWLGGIMFASTITTLLANPGLPARFADAQQDGGAGRRDIWHVGVFAFRDHWLTGAGVGNFANAYNREYLNVYSQYVLGWDWAAHNAPLMIATELGIIGFLIFVVAMILQFRIFSKLPFPDVRSKELRLILEGAFLGNLCSSFSTNDFSAKYLWLSFSVMALYRTVLLSSAAVKMRSAPPLQAVSQKIRAAVVH